MKAKEICRLISGSLATKSYRAQENTQCKYQKNIFYIDRHKLRQSYIGQMGRSGNCFKDFLAQSHIMLKKIRTPFLIKIYHILTDENGIKSSKRTKISYLAFKIAPVGLAHFRNVPGCYETNLNQIGHVVCDI